MTEQRDYSEEVAEALDGEVHTIVSEQHERVRQILLMNRPQLDDVAAALLARETLETEEFVEVFEGRSGADHLPDTVVLQPA
jgi:cell division protease FtsH